MLNFEKPNYKITEYVESKNYGKFELEPLERGFGTTLGNALRRIMLSSMPGSAIVAVYIEGIMHEFQTIEGIVEDVTTIVLNLKKVIVKNHSEEVVKVKLFAKLDMELIIANGRGYVPSDQNKSFVEGEKVGFIPIDAIYSPIERISYYVDNARVGQDANYDKLTMEVFTNGSIRPEEAMALSAKIMIEHLNIVTNLNDISDITGIMNAKQEDTKMKKLETSIDDLDFSVRAYNCLKRAGVNTLGDLTAKSEVEMMKIRNLGKKSLKEVIEKVKDMGLKFREDD